MSKLCARCHLTMDDAQFGVDKRNKDGLKSYCRTCHRLASNAWASANREKRNATNKLMRTKYPWYKAYKHIYDRCNDPKHQSYAYYGGKGIEKRISLSELKELWFRDGADKMVRPSIDRKDSDGHYEYSNCQWMEYTDNCRKGGK